MCDQDIQDQCTKSKSGKIKNGRLKWFGTSRLLLGLESLDEQYDVRIDKTAVLEGK